MFKFVRADLDKLADIVRAETGNNIQSKNFSMLESRLSGHIIRLGLKSVSEYWDYFSKNENVERELLQSLMTTHYTFFFREQVHFDLLEKWLNNNIQSIKKRYETTQKPLMVWSAACSRGQEVYSLAMFLDLNLLSKHGVPYHIVGSDIDGESVQYAKNGVYPIKEVNTIPQMYLQNYWRKGTGNIQNFAAVVPKIRQRTEFMIANLMQLDAAITAKEFDVIFCRNVFIYFSEENIRKIALALSAQLTEGGLFISGVSEPLRIQDWNFSSFGPSCYIKNSRHSQSNSSPQNQTVANSSSVAKATSKNESFSSGASESADEKSYSVLCVDDSPTIQLLLKKIFSSDKACAKIDMASNGKEAGEKLKQQKYDLITLDIHMPEMTGIEFLSTVYNKAMHPPVIMVSSVSRTDLELATKSLSLGAFDYVEKPAMNNLKKSAEEILTKAKMALRAKHAVSEPTLGNFDQAIGKKIVIPDASQCLRLIFADENKMTILKNSITGQKHEYRSPATLILWAGQNTSTVESELLQWSANKIISLKEYKSSLRPNHIYVARLDGANELMKSLKFKSVSVQVLTPGVFDADLLKNMSETQILIDETVADSQQWLEKKYGFVISDIAPSTSFASLSTEYFAKIRKAVA